MNDSFRLKKKRETSLPFEKFGSHRKKKPRFRDPSEGEIPLNARVMGVFQNHCHVQFDDGTKSQGIRYRSSWLKQLSVKEKAPVAVGDRVWVEGEQIRGRGPRERSLIRGSSRSVFVRQVIATHVDILCVVMSCFRPDFSWSLVDRFLLAGFIQKMRLFLVVTKMDEHPFFSSPSFQNEWKKIYSSLGIEVVLVSLKEDCPAFGGIQTLQAAFVGHRVVFCGESGVGKTSLLRALTGQPGMGAVAEVNPQTGMGRHATTGVACVSCLAGSEWIDTPGVRGFELVDCDRESVQSFFPEFLPSSGQLGEVVTAHPRFVSYQSLIR